MKRSLLFVIMAAIVITLIPAGIRAADEPAVYTTAIINITNPGFEADDQEPWYWWGEAGTGTYGVSTYKHGGTRSIEIVADRGDYVPTGLIQDFDCAPGDEITVSAWIMSPESTPLTNSDAFVRLEFWGTDVVSPMIAFESPHFTGAFNAWTKSSISGKAPEGVTKAKVGLFIWNPGTGHSGTVYFDDVEVTKKGPAI